MAESTLVITEDLQTHIFVIITYFCNKKGKKRNLILFLCSSIVKKGKLENVSITSKEDSLEDLTFTVLVGIRNYVMC